MEKNFKNIIILGIGFMFLFTAFSTLGNIEKTILENIHDKEDPTFNGDAYISLAIIYGVYGISNWFAPSVLAYTGPRGGMILGGTIYCFFFVTFFWPQTWLLYLFSGILGAAGAVLWIGQGVYLTRCSTTKTIGRNSSLFFAMFQSSMLFGNLFVYFQLSNQEINKDSRQVIMMVLTLVAFGGVILIALARHVDDNNTEENIGINETPSVGCTKAIVAFKSAKNLFVTRDILLLLSTFLYIGFELSFCSGVYGSTIGFTKRISDNPKRIVGLTGFFIGAGQVTGGTMCSLLSKQIARYGRSKIVIGGFIAHCLAYILIYLNLPNSSPFTDTDEISYFDPPLAWLALLCAVLMGFGDAAYYTQVFAIVATVFEKNSTSGFAICCFTMSIGTTLSFFCSTLIGLRIQICVLIIFATLGMICFCLVENAYKRRLSKENNQQF